MACFPDDGGRENVDSLTACSIFLFHSPHIFRFGLGWQDLSYFCEGLSQSIGGIHKATASHSTQNVLLFASLSVCSSKHLSGSGSSDNSRVIFTLPAPNPFTLGVLFFCHLFIGSSFLRTLFLRKEVTQSHPLKSAGGSQEREAGVKLESVSVQEEWCQAKWQLQGIRQSWWQLLWR